LGASPLEAAERPLLLERHKSVGIACEACHVENPPKVAASAARCLTCHGGDYEKLARLTEKVTPHNPHESHQGEMECGECHHVHKPSADYCGQCHQFGFQVP
jgi:cytochrome c3-like protein